MSTALPLTPEQRLLADSAARFFRDRGAPAAGTRESWQTMADLGWFGVAVPEDLGGLGAGMLEQSIIMMAAGEALSPLPLLMAH